MRNNYWSYPEDEPTPTWRGFARLILVGVAILVVLALLVLFFEQVGPFEITQEI